MFMMELQMQDTVLRQDIIDALDFEPSINAANIGVTVSDGVITLTGHVPTFREKIAAENAVRRIKGVKAIAEEIEVRPDGTNMMADDEIAKRAVNSIRWNVSIPADKVQVEVQKGWVTLTGKLEWQYQKTATADAVRSLAGVTGVSNNIQIVSPANSVDIRKRIEDAMKRDAEVEAQSIRVNVRGGKVTLNGKVKTWSERQAAEQAAWSSPGVHAVDDRLAII
jgi:osmotically-inducible protein OsmY